MPKPISGHSRRRRISRSNQFSSESSSRRWRATLTAAGAKRSSSTTGRHERPRVGHGREPAVRLVGPLHRRAHAEAPLDREVLPHPDLLAVEQHRRAGQREREAVDHPDRLLVAVEHRRQPPAQPAAEQLQRLVGPEGGEDLLALGLRELVERQLVVVAHEAPPLAVGGDLRRLAQRLAQRRRVAAREREVHRLHADEVEQHVQLVAVLVAEELARLGRLEVDLAEQHRLAVAPRDEGAQVAQQLVRVDQRPLRHAHRLEQERDGVDAEARQALLDPEAHDLRDLVAHRRVGDVEVGLVRVEAVQVVLAGLLVPRPVGVLLVGEDDVAGLLLGLLVAPHVEVAVGRVAVGARGLEPRVLVGGVVDDEVGDHPDPAVAAPCARTRRSRRASRAAGRRRRSPRCRSRRPCAATRRTASARRTTRRCRRGSRAARSARAGRRSRRRRRRRTSRRRGSRRPRSSTRGRWWP